MSDLFLHRVRNIWLSVEVNNQSATRLEKRNVFKLLSILHRTGKMILDWEWTIESEVEAHEQAA